MSGPCKSRGKGVREEKPDHFQERPLCLRTSCETWGEWGSKDSEGLLKQRLVDLTNLLGVVLRAMESLHLNGLGQGGWAREDKDQKEPPSSVQQQLKDAGTQESNEEL